MSRQIYVNLPIRNMERHLSTHTTVILREGGVSSTPRRQGSVATAPEYWIHAPVRNRALGEDDAGIYGSSLIRA